MRLSCSGHGNIIAVLQTGRLLRCVEYAQYTKDFVCVSCLFPFSNTGAWLVAPCRVMQRTGDTAVCECHMRAWSLGQIKGARSGGGKFTSLSTEPLSPGWIFAHQLWDACCWPADKHCLACCFGPSSVWAAETLPSNSGTIAYPSLLPWLTAVLAPLLRFQAPC